MKRFYILVFVNFLALNSILTQTIGKNIPRFKKDSLFILVSEDNRVFYIHKVQKRQTVQEISKLYRCPVSELESKPNKTPLNVGQPILIPVKGTLTTQISDSQDLRPVYYIVGKSEGLYHIAKRKLNISFEDIKDMNPLKNYSLTEGQILQVGWFNPNEIKPTVQTSQDVVETKSLSTFDSNTTELRPLRNEIIENSVPAFSFYHQGLAYKISGVFTNNRLLVLHNLAPLHSMIELSNPIVGRRVYATVVGRIPKVLPKDAILVVSDEVSKELGAVDKRFFVSVKYNQ